jgi:hypothetical protein
MAIGHLLATSTSAIEWPTPGLGPSRPGSVRPAHLEAMTTQTTTQTNTQMSPQADIHHRFEPVVTLAEADYLHVPVQTLYDLRSKGRGPRGFRVGRRLQFRQREVEAWLLGLEQEDEPQVSEQTRP